MILLCPWCWAASHLSSASNKDCLHYLHPKLPDVPTHEYGSTRVDYILCTPEMKPCLRKGGILPLNFLYPSDHRTGFVDIDIQQALNTKVEELLILSTVPSG